MQKIEMQTINPGLNSESIKARNAFKVLSIESKEIIKKDKPELFCFLMGFSNHVNEFTLKAFLEKSRSI